MAPAPKASTDENFFETGEQFADLLEESLGNGDSFEGAVVKGTVVAVDGDGELDAVTPCVDVPPLISDIVCVKLPPVSVTAVSLISITSLAVTVGSTCVPVTDVGIASAIFKNCILPDVLLVVNPPAVESSV